MPRKKRSVSHMDKLKKRIADAVCSHIAGMEGVPAVPAPAEIEAALEVPPDPALGDPAAADI